MIDPEKAEAEVGRERDQGKQGGVRQTYPSVKQSDHSLWFLHISLDRSTIIFRQLTGGM
jgi:hypothetical protein